MREDSENQRKNEKQLRMKRTQRKKAEKSKTLCSTPKQSARYAQTPPFPSVRQLRDIEQC